MWHGGVCLVIQWPCVAFGCGLELWRKKMSEKPARRTLAACLFVSGSLSFPVSLFLSLDLLCLLPPLPPHTPKTASFEIQNVGEWCWMTRMGYSFCKLWAFMPALPFYPLLLAVLNLPALLIVAVWSRQKKIYPRIEMIH